MASMIKEHFLSPWLQRKHQRRRILELAESQTLTHYDSDTKNERCVICMEDLEPLEEIRQLPCKHGFHPECIDPVTLIQKKIINLSGWSKEIRVLFV